MAYLLGLLIGGAALLAVAAVWLAVRATRKEAAALHSLVDRRGWSHSRHAEKDLVRVATHVLPDAAAPRLRDAIAGPSMAGPFRLARAHNPAAPRRETSILHIRTPAASPGIHVRPAAGFKPAGSSDALAKALGHERFARLYDVTAVDPEFAADALDWDTCALLVAPQRPVRLDWQGHDLVIAFPVAARTPRGIESLVAWGAQLASRLSERHRSTTRSPPLIAPTPSRLRWPSDVDLTIP